MKIEDRVKEIIGKILRKNVKDLNSKVPFTDLGADSLDQVELIMAFEDYFDLEISEEDAEKIKTVQDAINYLRART